jgi:hypothetical protein
MQSRFGRSGGGGGIAQVRELGRDDWNVAVGVVGSGPLVTIALEECDRRAAGVFPRGRAAEFGR